MNAQRDPKPAPFPVGARVKYIGTRQIAIVKPGRTYDPADPSCLIPVLFPGAVGTVERVGAGRRGTGRHLRDDDGPMFDDEGNAVIDTTRDGYSVWVVDGDTRDEHQGRCIDPDGVDEWEAI